MLHKYNLAYIADYLVKMIMMSICTRFWDQMTLIHAATSNKIN